jgi:hypothetical protein
MSTLADENINTIISLLAKPYNGKNISLLKYNSANSDRIMHFDINSNPVKIITDFDKKCYAECSCGADSIKSIYDRFNLVMVFKDKTPKNILEEISKLLVTTEKKKLVFDPFHINHMIDEYCKHVIDFKQLGTIFDKTLEMIKGKLVNDKIPKELLMSPIQLLKKWILII